jgi:glycolate oxidase
MKVSHLKPYPALDRPSHLRPLTPELIDALRQITGPDYVSVDPHDLEAYGHDWTEDFLYFPEVVVRPKSTDEVSQVMCLCYDHDIPLTPMGARTGLSGGILPVYGGVALGLDRMNRVLEVDTRNLQVTVEAGCVTQHIMDAAAEHNLMYPPDPSSKGSCTIGGNLAENAGGAHAVKYGITRDYVLALEAVLPNGEIIRTGANVLKNSTGYSLTHLLVGSEGTLAIITQATLRLEPKPRTQMLMLAPFADATAACDAVSAVFRAGITPSALEFMERDAIDFAQQFLGVNTYSLDGVAAHLLVEVDGNDEAQIMAECEQIADVLATHGAGDILFADDKPKQDELWRLRRCIGEAVKGNTIYKEEDTVVPRAELAKLLAKVKELSTRYGFYSVCYGHAGDGNLHVNIIKRDISDEDWENSLPVAIRELFEYVVSLKGTISGEHGIGWVQRRYLDVAFSPAELALMRGIKHAFDPKGILNPGKILP